MRAYLDHNATSPLRPEARDALARALDAVGGNASSIHAEGRAARRLVEDARAQVAAFLEASPREVVFTSGGSEAIAAAVRGACERAEPSRRRIVVAAIEHSAVLASARAMERHGFEVVTVGCGRTGRVDPDRFAAAIGGGVALAALQAANNETGVIQPVEAVGATCRRARVPFFVDAVQAAGKIAIERKAWCADLLAVSGHKLGGPQGSAALVVEDAVPMAPLIPGGGQERRRRGGTEAVAAIAGFGAACEAAATDLRGEAARLGALTETLERGLRTIAPGLRVHGDTVARLPNTTNVAFPGVVGETLVIALDLDGIAASTGSACASGAVEPSHVLEAMGCDRDEARATVRFSTGWSTTGVEVERLLAALPEILARARMPTP
jgi:cysteine desulfurase